MQDSFVLGKRETMVGEQRQNALNTTPSVAGNVIGLPGLLRCPQYEELCSVRSVRSISDFVFVLSGRGKGRKQTCIGRVKAGLVNFVDIK